MLKSQTVRIRRSTRMTYGTTSMSTFLFLQYEASSKASHGADE
jgi:hypothetical protein